MLDKKKKGTLDLSLRIILTEVGVNFFVKNRKPLVRFKMIDGRESHGIALRTVTPGSLQQMLLIGYISKIELSRPEFVTRRSDVMDLAKLVVYGFLYNQFDEVFLERLLASPVVRRWNRSHPQKIIDSKTSFPRTFLAEKLKEKQKLIKQIRNEIARPIQGAINKDSNLLLEEKNTQIFLCERYMQNLRPISWYVLTLFRDDPDYPSLVADLQKQLREYVEKARIAEYLALMIMEFLINAENSNIRQYAEKKYQGGVAPEKLQFDEAMRSRVLASMEKDDENVTLLWKLGGDKHYSIGIRNRLQISIFNKESEVLALKASVDNQMSARVRERSLSDFFGSDTDEGPGMGLYYLSYLNEECRKVGIRFDSLVNEDSQTGQAVVTLNLSF